MSTVDADGTLFDGDTESDFGWHFGGGLEIPLGDAAKLVGDLRYVYLNYSFGEVPGSDEIDSDFYMATGGLLFNL
jgi:opacity protein-like surface antigen